MLGREERSKQKFVLDRLRFLETVPGRSLGLFFLELILINGLAGLVIVLLIALFAVVVQLPMYLIFGWSFDDFWAGLPRERWVFVAMAWGVCVAWMATVSSYKKGYGHGKQDESERIAFNNLTRLSR